MKGNNEQQYITKEEYEELLRKYNKLNLEFYNLKSRKIVRVANKVDKALKKVKIYKGLNKILKRVGMPKILYNNFFIKKAEKLSFPEYKTFRFKRDRMKKYYVDSSKIKHNYQEDLVSIIMPVYNGEKYIEQAIDSILKQSYEYFELIIINDGSLDNTKKIINKYSKKDKRINVINQDNQKLANALNKGLNLASGEYIMWVSHDDILKNNCIEEMVTYLKENPKIDFTYPNIRLIDENNKEIIDEEPTEDEIKKNGIKFNPLRNLYPNNLLKICTVKSYAVAPICLYKSIVAKTLAPYSSNRLMVENRDYWMRANDLFTISHLKNDEVLFDYRQYNTEKDISKQTNLLMLYEGFRQDFYLMSLLWVIDNPEEHPEFVSEIEKRGHMIIDSKKANSLVLNDVYNNMVYVSFKSNDRLKKVPDTAYKVVISDKQFKGKNADLYISTNMLEDIVEIDKQKGFFAIEDYNTIFSFIDTKAREFFLRRIENYVEDLDRVEKHPVSVVVVTYKRTEKVPIVLESVLKQTEPRKNFEILVVNNDIYTRDIYELVEEMRAKHKLSKDFLRYVEAPIKGVSYARNVGMFDARGEIIHWLDDDSISDEKNVEEMRKAFKEKPNAGVIGGNIILKKPDPVPEIILEGREKMWSQYYFEGDKILKITRWFELPYGANYATVKRDILRVGGFRLCYGRVGHNWVGGEEVVSSALVRRLGKDVYVQPKAIVHHDPQYHRYSYEHVRNTLVASPQTTVKMEQDMVIDPEYHNVGISKRAYRNRKRKQKKIKDKIERYYEEQLTEGHKRAIENMRIEMSERIKGTKYINNMDKFIPIK